MHDIRYAFRQMKRAPGFVIVAILTLGLGIGANTAIFSIVNAILLRPLPYKDSDRLVRIVENIPAEESFSGLPERTTGMSPDAFVDWRSRTTTLSGMAMERPLSMTLAGREAVRLSGLQLSPALFPMLGVQPALGRVFEAAEEKPGSAKVIIVSHAVWQKYLGADSQISGQILMLDDSPYIVVGVMPRDFSYPNPQTDFWTPLSLPPQEQVLGLQVIARLKDGIPITAAAEEATRIGREFRGQSQNDPQPPGPPRIEVLTIKEELVAPVRLPLLVFVIAVSFVFLVACINVANLFLARATIRNKEIAIRMMLGAGRGRVLRQLLTENILIAFLGGAAGIALALAASRFFIAYGHGLARLALTRVGNAGNVIPRLNEVTIDTRVLLFTLGLTVATGILFGLIPAFRIGRSNALHAIDSRTGGSSGVSLRVLRSAMVIGQVALTLVLLLGAGLMIKSFVRLSNTDLGYDPANVLTFNIPQRELAYPQEEWKQPQRTAFAHEVTRRVASIPGVEAAGFTNVLPMVQMRLSLGVNAEGRSSVQDVDCFTVSPDYFRAMGMRVIDGRGFAVEDARSRRPVYVINRTLAHRLFSNGNPIGRTVSLGPNMAAGEVAGVVDDVRQRTLDEQPSPVIFVGPEHTIGVVGEAEAGVYFAVRTRRAAAAIVPEIRNIVRDLDPKLAVDNIATMNQIISNSIVTPRSYAVLLGSFSAAALVLATIGLYGVLSYFVTQRTREIGIRLALGAKDHEVIGLVLREGLAMGASGVGIGLVSSLALTKYLEKMLFGVTALDPATFLIVSATLVVVTFIASYVPARHATRIDPLAALRHE